jgi:hypothetical protein
MLVGWIGRRDKVIGREAERASSPVVFRDPNLGLFPSTTPCVDMSCRSRSKAMGACRSEVISRCFRNIRIIA